MNGGELFGLVERQQRREGRMQPEKAVQIEDSRSGGLPAVVGAGQSQGRAQAVVAVIAVRDHDIEAVRAAAQKEHYQRIAAGLTRARPQGDAGQRR